MERTYSTPAGQTLLIVESGGLDQIAGRLGATDSLSPKRLRVAVVTDETVGALYGQQVAGRFQEAGAEVHELRVPPGEASKSLGTLGQVYAFFAQSRLARDGLVIALGGGVVSDLAGLAAATWMRGVRFGILPTTLEAQIDAAIGGKTAINVPGGKNLVGVFHQPSFVLIDPACLSSLETRDIRAGLAESVKHALIASPGLFEWHEANAEAIAAREPSTMTELIERNVDIKVAIVERDPFERSGERMVLNFGHTLGHAIEACCNYSLRHGECVALGMLAACRLSQSQGLLPSAVVERVAALLERLGLPTRLEPGIPFDRIMEVIARDKKSRGGQVRWVLLEAIGKTRVSCEIDDTLVDQAYASLLDS